MGSYRVEVDRQVRKETRRLPGNARQRVIRALRALREQPRPPGSESLSVEEIEVDLPPGIEPRRIRIESWRIVYVIEEEDLRVSVLGVRKRPPYRYEDLEDLLAGLLR